MSENRTMSKMSEHIFTHKRSATNPETYGTQTQAILDTLPPALRTTLASAFNASLFAKVRIDSRVSCGFE